MRAFREIKGWLEMALDSLSERMRDKAQEPRIWVQVWDGGAKLQEETCDGRIRSICVLTGLVESGAESDRLLKAGAIQVRPWDCSLPWRVAGLKEVIPAGEAFMVRRGKSFYGVKTVMVPVEGQAMTFWDKELAA